MQYSDLTDKSVTISWKPPKSDGGLPLKEYILERRDTKRTTWAPVDKLNPDITSFTVQNLVVGNDYYFRVMAVNEEGTSPPLEGEPVRPQKAADVPGEPRGPLNVSNVSGTSAALSWKLSDKDGGSPITEYLIEASTDNVNWTKIGTVDKLSNKYKAQDLEDGKDYTFRVSAVNKVGPSQPLVSKPVSIEKPAGMTLFQVHSRLQTS
jgi:titin